MNTQETFNFGRQALESLNSMWSWLNTTLWSGCIGSTWFDIKPLYILGAGLTAFLTGVIIYRIVTGVL